MIETGRAGLSGIILLDGAREEPGLIVVLVQIPDDAFILVPQITYGVVPLRLALSVEMIGYCLTPSAIQGDTSVGHQLLRSSMGVNTQYSSRHVKGNT